MLSVFVLSFLLSLFALPLFAAGEVYSNSSSGVTFGSLDEACQYGGVQYGYCGAVYAGFSGGVHRWSCRTKPWAGDPTCLVLRQAILSSGCASPNVLDTNTGICNPPSCAEGQVRNTITNVCQPPCHASGTAGGSNYVSPYTVVPTSICRDGCSLTVGAGFTMPWSSGTVYGVSGLVHTGEFCNGDINGTGSGNGEDVVHDEPTDPPPITVTPENDPPRCKSGQCPGDVNGVYVCVACSTVATDTKPVTTYDRTKQTTTTGTPPNETSVTKTTDTKATHDGSGTVTTSSTTSTTTTAPNGSGGTTTSTETATQEKKESQESFCKENPTSAFCKEGRWSGSCESDFQCEGDAVQCATARASWSAYCLDAKYETTEAGNLANAIIGGNDPGAGDNPLNPENVEEIDIASSAAIGPRQLTDTCIPNQTFSVAGASFTFDTGKFCDLMSICGNILVALASIAAFRIVGSA